MSTTMTYVDALLSLDTDSLTRTVTLSRLPTTHPADIYDLATRLAHPEAIARRAEHLSADDLHALATGSPAGAAANALLLADHTGSALPTVRETVGSLLEEISPDQPSAADLSETAPEPWHAVTALQSLLLSWHGHLVPVTSSGHVPVSALADPARVLDLEPGALAQLATIAQQAGLLCTVDGGLGVTSRADAWLALPTADAWRTLADTAADDDLAAIARTDAGGADALALIGAAQRRWPLGGRWLSRKLTDQLAQWRTLGLLDAHGAFTATGAAWLNRDEAALADIAESWPAVTEYGYLYNHLELLVPGLLPPRLARRLRLLADPVRLVETHTYQVSPSSVRRGRAHGLSVGEIREFLASLLRGDLSQPLQYVLDAEDRAPAPTAVRPPALPEITSGSASRRSATAQRAHELVDGYRNADDDERRQGVLTWALREHAPVRLTVRSRDVERTMTLELTGVSGPRVRGREPGSELERTIPMSAVTQITPEEDTWDR